MPRSKTRAVLFLSAVVLAGGFAFAPRRADGQGNVPIRVKPTPSAVAAAPAPTAANPRPLQPAEEEAPLPAGHPAMPPDEGGEDEEAPPDGAPKDAAHDGTAGMFKAPPDTSEEDPSLPPGSLAVDVRDADDKPLSNVPLVLVVLHQSVAKGQNKENKPVRTDEKGRLLLEHLETGSGVSYWVKELVGPATFASSPAQLGPARGVHQVLHAYPVARDLQTALIVAQGVIYFEVKDDRVQVEEAVTLFNFGKSAWVPDNLVLKLPKGFTAVTSQAQMSDQGVDAVDKEGARIRGTFAPGRHDLDFRWQLPYDGEKDLTVDVNLPPHIAIMRVMAAAGHETTLEVSGFPDAQKRTDRQGQRVLITEMQVKRESPLTTVHVAIRGLLTPGPGRIVATVVAACAVAFGLFLGFGRKVRSKAGATSERAGLLADIEELERARLRGDVGPKTYERARRELVNAIALTLDAAT